MSPRNKELSEQMREEARTALLAAGRQLFSEQGYFKSKVSDVARAAGMSQGNVYWYFSSKEELLKAVIRPVFALSGGIGKKPPQNLQTPILFLYPHTKKRVKSTRKERSPQENVPFVPRSSGPSSPRPGLAIPPGNTGGSAIR